MRLIGVFGAPSLDSTSQSDGEANPAAAKARVATRGAFLLRLLGIPPEQPSDDGAEELARRAAAEAIGSKRHPLFDFSSSSETSPTRSTAAGAQTLPAFTFGRTSSAPTRSSPRRSRRRRRRSGAMCAIRWPRASSVTPGRPSASVPVPFLDDSEAPLYSWASRSNPSRDSATRSTPSTQWPVAAMK